MKTTNTLGLGLSLKNQLALSAGLLLLGTLCLVQVLSLQAIGLGPR